jgi:hypothetical protein
MAFTIQIAGKAFKVENDIIVGRGAPFEHLDQHKDVARAHVLIVSENENLQIKDLGSESGTTVNGVALKANQFYPLNVQDEIKLGSVALKIQTNNLTPQSEIIQRFSNENYGKLPFGYLYLAMFILAQTMYLISTKKNLDFGNVVASLGISALLALVFALPIWFGSRMGGFLFPNKHKVYLGESGFTIHHVKSSMSIMFKNIESIIFKPYTINIVALGEKISLMHIDQSKELKQILKKNCPDKWKNNRWEYVYVIGGTFFGILLYLFFLGFDGDEGQIIYLEMVVAIFFGAFFLLAALSKKIFIHLYKMNEKNYQSVKFRMAFAAVLCFFFAGTFYTDIEEINAQKIIAQKCLTGDKTSCKTINHCWISYLGLKKQQQKELMQLACTSGVSGACLSLNLSNKRMPASNR